MKQKTLFKKKKKELTECIDRGIEIDGKIEHIQCEKIRLSVTKEYCINCINQIKPISCIYFKMLSYPFAPQTYYDFYGYCEKKHCNITQAICTGIKKGEKIYKDYSNDKCKMRKLE